MNYYTLTVGVYAAYLIATFFLWLFGVLSLAWFLFGLTPLLVLLCLALLIALFGKWNWH
jgi:hypothetical protein